MIVGYHPTVGGYAGEARRIVTDVLESYEIQFSTLTDNLGDADSSDIANVSETGVLVALAGVVSVAPAGAPDTRLEVTVDGGTARALALWNGGTTWGIAEIRGFAIIGDGSTVGDRFYLPFGSARYAFSLRIKHIVQSAGTGGVIRFSFIRGVKVD